jgi:hypothetical protein
MNVVIIYRTKDIAGVFNVSVISYSALMDGYKGNDDFGQEFFVVFSAGNNH